MLNQALKTKLFYAISLLLYSMIAQAQTGKSYKALKSHDVLKQGNVEKNRWEYDILDFKKDRVGLLSYIIYSERVDGQTYAVASVDDDWSYYKWQKRNDMIQLEGLSDDHELKSLKINGNGFVSSKNKRLIFKERKPLQPADTVIGKTYALNLYDNEYSAFSFDKENVEIASWKEVGTTEKTFVIDEREKPKKYKWVADGNYILILGFEPWDVALFKSNTVIGLYEGKLIPLTLETRKPKK